MSEDPETRADAPSGDDAHSADDSRADAKAILIMFVALVAFAVHFASGFSFDF